MADCEPQRAKMFWGMTVFEMIVASVGALALLAAASTLLDRFAR